MTNKEKLNLISDLEALKTIVLKSFDYKDDINSLPQDLKLKYVQVYTKLKQNSNYKQFPLLVNLLEADSLSRCVEGMNFTFEKLKDIEQEKELWNDSYEHAIGEINLIGNSDISTMPVALDGSSIGVVKEKISINKIQLHNFRFFTDDEQNNIFEPNGQNLLVYGENGSGKSTLYKAFELLTKISRENISDKFKENKNIFNIGESSSINFEFSNNEVLNINDDSDTNNDLVFINNLSVFLPMLNYQQLLDISYESKTESKDKNLYDFFEKILENYPIGNGIVLKNLKEKEDEQYFNLFEQILVKELFDTINMFLHEFKQGFKLSNIKFSAVYKKITLEIEYCDEVILKYHQFLNEARLSALAISIYFSIIKKQFRLLHDDALKILVLDDLLISLDMSNRLNLIDILKHEFSDFQIFFFTHDKGFFEILKDKMSWKAYEMYVDNEGEFEKPYIKKSLNYFETAQKHFDKYDYPACANYLRKEVERIKKLVNQNDIDGVPVDRSMQIVKGLVNSDDFTNFSQPNTTDDACIGKIRGKLIGIKNNLNNAREPSVEINLHEIGGILHRILHPQSHDDTSRPLYKKELEEAIGIIGGLRDRANT